MNKLESVHVAYATDVGYLLPTCVSIYSLAKFSNESRNYCIHIILSKDMTAFDRSIFSRVVKPFSNVFVECVNGLEIQAKTTMTYITAETYQRLFLHHYLSDVEKVIWLDGDTVVCDDIAHLFDTELGETYIAGVAHYSDGPSGTSVSHSERIGLRYKYQYLNAGVLIFNLQEIRKDKVDLIFNRLMYAMYTAQDQDVINISCHGKKTPLPLKYNFNPLKNFLQDVSILEQFSMHEILEAVHKPAIIHFFSTKKPWNHADTDHHGIWHRFYAEIEELLPSALTTSINSYAPCHADHSSNVSTEKKLIFYGAGKCCSRMLGLLNVLNKKKPDCIWDKNATNIRSKQMIPVNLPFTVTDNAIEKNETVVVVCVDNNNVCAELINTLKENGYSSIVSANDYAIALWESISSMPSA